MHTRAQAKAYTPNARTRTHACKKLAHTYHIRASERLADKGVLLDDVVMNAVQIVVGGGAAGNDVRAEGNLVARMHL